MTLRETLDSIRADVFRVYGHSRPAAWLHACFWGIGVKYAISLRIGRYLGERRRALFPLWLAARLVHRHYSLKFGIDIHPMTHIGPGLYIGHFGGIIVSPSAVLGRDCNLSPGVVIGIASRGKRKGTPALGDRVYIGPGAKLNGGIRVGDDVAIGANCVVTQDVPDHAVVVGVPGRIISFNGSSEYILNTAQDLHGFRARAVLQSGD